MLFKILPPIAAVLLACVSAGAAPRVVDYRVGFDGHFVLGAWTPVAVTVEGLTEAEGDFSVEVVAPDYDAVPVVYQQPIPKTGRDTQTVHLLIQIGKRTVRPHVAIRPLAKGKRQHTEQPQVASASLNSQVVGSPSLQSIAHPATNRLLLQVGSDDTPDLISADDLSLTLVRLESVEQLPVDPMAYEAVEVVLIVAGDAAMSSDVQAESPPLRALGDWLQNGGRVVVAAGPNSTNALRDTLAPLLPGKLAGEALLPSASSLERFAGSEKSIGLRSRSLNLPATVLELPQSDAIRIEAAEDAAPLVARVDRGLGEVTFLAVDPTDQRLAEWPGLPMLMSRLARIEQTATLRDQSSGRSTSLLTSGPSSLATAMYRRLGDSYAGVWAPSFLAIVAVAIGYLLLIGPIDFLLLRKLGVEMAATWITFPAIALAIGGGAWWLGTSRTPDGPRVNQLEVVTIDARPDAPADNAQGALWAQCYSPESQRWNIAAKPAGAAPTDAEAVRFGWWGPAGRGGIAFDQTVGAQYAVAPDGVSLRGVPIATRSTKGVTARWQGNAAAIDATLARTPAELVEGEITNDSGAELQNAFLIYGQWAWRLGNLCEGATATIDDSRPPIRLKTLARRDYFSPDSARGTAASDANLDDLDPAALGLLMMFTDALQGAGVEEFQRPATATLDLSRLLETGAAVLVAHVDDNHATDMELNGKQLPATATSKTTLYRYILRIDPSL